MGDFVSINLLEVMTMTITTCVMVRMTGGTPVMWGRVVLMRADSEATVAWVKRCRGEWKKKIQVGALATD